MPTAPDTIANLVKTISSLSQSWTERQSFDRKEDQAALVIAAEELALAVREPDENVYFIGTQLTHNAMLRTAIAMNVFEKLPKDGSSISNIELAEATGVNPDLLKRVMRACISTHMFQTQSPDRYAHNALSRVYVDSSRRAMTAQMYEFIGKGVFAMPEFLKQTNYQTCGTYDSGAFQLGARTPLGFWEYLSAEPERMRLFSAGMRSRTTIGNGRASGTFPFGVELAKQPCSEDEIAMVDVGGGYGQLLEAVRQDWPDIRGRLVLQDLDHVIDEFEISGRPAYIETSKGSFFQPQKIIGARIYHFRRIFHDWDQTKGREILVLTKAAMRKHSRVLIADMLVPEIDAPRDMALQDINMMSFGGIERTEGEWKSLVQSAGLVLRKIWLSDGSSKHAVIEAVLPGSNDQTESNSTMDEWEGGGMIRGAV